jgi:hypothetical protein
MSADVHSLVTLQLLELGAGPGQIGLPSPPSSTHLYFRIDVTALVAGQTGSECQTFGSLTSMRGLVVKFWARRERTGRMEFQVPLDKAI